MQNDKLVLEEAGFTPQQIDALETFVGRVWERHGSAPGGEQTKAALESAVRDSIGKMQEEQISAEVKLRLGEAVAAMMRDVYNELRFIRSEMNGVKVDVHKTLGSYAWKTALVLVAQTGVIVGLVKLI